MTSLGACGLTTGISAPTTSSPSYTEVVCQTFHPIEWARKDTDETIRGVKEHNAALAALRCPAVPTPIKEQ